MTAIRPASGEDRGSATVLVLAAAMVCATITAGWLAWGRAALARQHAETAADLAALAGAQSLARLDTAPCAAAAQAAAANGGQLVTCSVSGTAVTVAVSVSQPMSARALARAGAQEDQ